jgi:hypothetical protein
LEYNFEGFSARIGYWCCAAHGHMAMSKNGRDNYIFSHLDSVIEAFGFKVAEGAFDGFGQNILPEKKGIYFNHHFEDATLKEKVVQAFANEEFLIEWKERADDTSILVYP